MSRSETCAVCGQEVRWGTRDGRTMYHHREQVDHVPKFGNITPVALVRTVEEVEDLTIPEPEVACHPVDIEEFAPQSGIRQLANLVAGITRATPSGKSSKSLKHPPMAPGWELVNLTHSRGPYVGSKGTVLSISDCHVLRARAPQLDGTVRVAVGSWRDGGYDFGYIGVIENGRLSPRKVDADTLKNWIKGKA